MICKTTVNKAGWGDGPWKTEPDCASFRHRGLDCQLDRDPDNGVWIGCIFVPRSSGAWDHPVNIEVHGEMHWAECTDKNFRLAMFDCGHIDDLPPAGPRNEFSHRLQYRTFEYAVDQCRRMADQIARATVLRLACKDILQTLRWAMRRSLGVR